MVEYFKVRKDGSRFKIIYQDKTSKRIMARYSSYLQAKFRAFMGNQRIATIERKFGIQ